MKIKTMKYRKIRKELAAFLKQFYIDDEVDTFSQADEGDAVYCASEEEDNSPAHTSHRPAFLREAPMIYPSVQSKSSAPQKQGSASLSTPQKQGSVSLPMPQKQGAASMAMPRMQEAAPMQSAPAIYAAQDISGSSLGDFLDQSLDENSVAKKLNQYMYERDITTAVIYERCFVDRRLISKITGGSNYHPSKMTMLALCIGLRLNLEEAEEFLLLAGFCFSTSSKYDLIFKFMIQNQIYDLDTINEMLYEYDQPCLGA